MLFEKIDTAKKGSVTRDQFIQFYKSGWDIETKEKNMFNVLKGHHPAYLVPDDFKPLL